MLQSKSCFILVWYCFSCLLKMIEPNGFYSMEQACSKKRQFIPRTFYWYPLSLFWNGKMKYASGQLLHMNKIRKKPLENDVILIMQKPVDLPW